MSDTGLNEKINGFLKTALEKFIVSDFNEAIRDLRAAEVLDRDNPEILYNLGVCYSRLGLFKTSVQYYERLIALPDTFIEILTVRKLLAFSLIQTGQYTDAEKAIEGVLLKTPRDTAALSMKGYCLEKLGRYRDAVTVYSEIIKIDKGNLNSYNSIAYILAMTKTNLDRALKLARTACEKKDNNPAYLDTLGFVCMKRGDRAAAKKYFTKALELAPFSKEIKAHLRELAAK